MSCVPVAGTSILLHASETNATAANLVAQRIREGVANDDKGPKLSVSVGVAMYPKDGHTIESLLCAADSQLYSMKRQRILPDDSGRAVGWH
jgi:GGDEF domain-containing protein